MDGAAMAKDTTSRKSDLLPGTLEMLILKTLDRNEEPMHGYGIALYIKQISRDVLRVEEGSLYPALQRLAVKGLINGAWRDSDTGRRARYYKLTSAGRKQLIEEVADFENLLQAILRIVQPA
jgi:PadR family transcriptional regulator PadR